jgi:hypothetical protein
MTPTRFERLARAYGAELARWPDAVRGEAATLVGAMPELRAVLESEARVDRALRAARRPVSDQRGERVCRAVLDRLDERPRVPAMAIPYWERPRALASAAVLLVVVALAGFAVGDAGLMAPDPVSGDGFSALVSSDVILVSWE